MALDCLRNYVGILGCGLPEPESGLFINSLGIPLESIEKLSTPEQQNFVGVWSDVQTRATRRLNTAITSFFSQRYKLNSIREIVAIQSKPDPLVTTPAGAQWRGVIYAARDINGDPSSVLQSLNIQSVAVYCPIAGATITLGIFDLQTGARLITKVINSSLAGDNLFKINAGGYIGGFFIGYYATFAGAELKIDANEDASCDCSTSCCDGVLKGATVDGATVNDFDILTLETLNNTFSVRPILSLSCSWDGLVCGYKSYFATAYWYALGEELMSERIYSARLNKFTLMGKDEALARRDEFKARYHEELTNAIESITFDTSDCCIECNETVIKREVCL
jgi:hypothetical protein